MHETNIDFEALWQAVIALPSHLSPYSVHGPDHWRRVERNALILASQSGAHVSVVRLFALFHDSRRENDDHDPDHGKRGAALAHSWRGKYFDLPDEQYELLHYACTWHTDRHFDDDPTIATCWDADRLDLGRVGITPHPKYLNTNFAKEIALHGNISPWLQLLDPPLKSVSVDNP
jgi:uncharacterized protein